MDRMAVGFARGGVDHARINRLATATSDALVMQDRAVVKSRGAVFPARTATAAHERNTRAIQLNMRKEEV